MADNIDAAIQLLQQPQQSNPPLRTQGQPENGQFSNDPVANAIGFLQHGQPNVQQTLNIGASGFGDALKQTLAEQGAWGQGLAAIGTGADNFWQGLKQRLGYDDDQAIQANRIMAKASPTAAAFGNVGAAGLTTLLPGANTLAGATLYGSLNGALQPTQGGESALTNTLTSGALGAGGQVVGSGIGALATRQAAKTKAMADALASQNATRDATLKAGQGAGYVVPPTATNPSLMATILESLGGKAAIGQQASGQNGAVTNAIARKALGLPPDAPFSEDALTAYRNSVSQPYRDVAALPPLPPQRITGINNYPLFGPQPAAPADILKDLQQTRFDASNLWKNYNRTGEVSVRDQAVAATAKANSLENDLATVAQTNGRPDLAGALADARKKIAMSYSVENAMNPATGDISARALGQMQKSGVPLSNGLDTAGNFALAFPKYTQPATAAQGSGVTALSPVVAAMAAKEGWELGHGVLGVPGGIGGAVIGAGLPFSRSAARALALGGVGQSAAVPSYTPMSANVMGAATPQRIAAMVKALAMGGQNSLPLLAE